MATQCYFCKKDDVEQGHILLVNSPDVANALVFSCDECSAKNEHIFVSCNDCGEMLDVGSKGETGGGYLETVLNDNYIAYCKKCAIEMKTDRRSRRLRLCEFQEDSGYHT